jgi:hypothetical protein
MGAKLNILSKVYSYILSSFTEIWEIKFGNIPFLAALVYDLQRYHPDFSVSVVDQAMEDIRAGMEVSSLECREDRKLMRDDKNRTTSSSTIKDGSRQSDTSGSCTCIAW